MEARATLKLSRARAAAASFSCGEGEVAIVWECAVHKWVGGWGGRVDWWRKEGKDAQRWQQGNSSSSFLWRGGWGCGLRCGTLLGGVDTARHRARDCAR